MYIKTKDFLYNVTIINGKKYYFYPVELEAVLSKLA